MVTIRASANAMSFSESVIREMTRLANKHGAINLAQGFPDFPTAAILKDAAKAAIDNDYNQYPITWGEPEFRYALANKYLRHYGMHIDPETDICVTCGATEAMVASLLGVLEAGDEVVIFEPYYENYSPVSAIVGAQPKYVPLHGPTWILDEVELAAAFSGRTRGIILNTPNNPSGKVFTRGELTAIASLCQKWDVVAFSDEIYEHITYGSARHIPIATIPGMEDRTVTVSSLSKTYAVTGWRVGWAIGPATLIDGIRRVHDYVTVGAPTPLQHAGTTAVGLPTDYYETLKQEYWERRQYMLAALAGAGFDVQSPEGAYYVMADISHLGLGDDLAATKRLVEEVGIAVVPGSSFYHDPSSGRHSVRFAFCKRLATLKAAAARLDRVTAK
jgi:aspartate/methionine/tyrosine aminotransferase